ncbi:MAG: DUF2490 domain-containing protein [Parabacteroides sp.]|nr:DUF2490 domain-containing protein [Parabacteroides sp.]
MSLNKKGILIFFCWLLLSTVNAKEGSNISLRLTLSKKVYKNLSIQVEEDLRSTSDFHTPQWLLSIAEINYQFHPMIKGGIGYTNLANFLNSKETRNRYYIYLNGKYSICNLRISLVERFQSTYKKHNNKPNNYLRSKLTIGYTINQLKLEPFVYAEPFNNTSLDGKMRLDRIRFSGGLNYKINSSNTLQFYYRYHIFKQFDPVNYLHALGIVYKLHL